MKNILTSAISLIFLSFFLKQTHAITKQVFYIIWHLSRPIYCLSYISGIFNGYDSDLYLPYTQTKVSSNPHNDHLESATGWIYVQLFSSSVLNDDHTGQQG